jgi:hypothetical protein
MKPREGNWRVGMGSKNIDNIFSSHHPMLGSTSVAGENWGMGFERRV